MTYPPAGAANKAEVFKASDGATLVGQLFYPATKPRAVLIVNGAVGVPQKYYSAFAAYAAEKHGVIAFTYDYRDTGKSATGPVRKSSASLADWGLTDQKAAREKMRKMFPGVSLWIVGHSLGGMTMSLHRDTDDIEHVTCVASGSVHHNDHPWPYRATALMFWFGLGPLICALAGFLPGKALGIGEDLPSKAYWQWRRWCTSKLTFGGEEGRQLPQSQWDQGKTPARLIAFSDDDLIPVHCVVRLASHFGLKESDVEVLDPQTVGLKTIGHISAFSERSKAVWDFILPPKTSERMAA